MNRNMILLVEVVLVLALSVADQEFCVGPPDIVFIIDESVSVAPKGFKQEKEFVLNLCKKISIGENATRIAVITFAQKVIVRFNFTTYKTNDEVSRAISNISYESGGLTNTHHGISTARTEIFKDARQGATKIMIVITDGICQSLTGPELEARKAFADGITIIAIGVAIDSEPKRKRLLEFASEPKNETVFKVDSFDNLKNIIEKVSKHACAPDVTHAPTHPTPEDTPDVTHAPTHPTPEDTFFDEISLLPPKRVQANCSGPTDIVFMIDEALRISNSNFKYGLHFLQSVVSGLDVGESKTRIAAVTVSNNPETQFDLFQYKSVAEIIEALGNIKQKTLNHATDIVPSFTYVRDKIFSEARSEATKILLILTAEGFYEDQLLYDEAAETKDRRIVVILIAVGNMENHLIAKIVSWPEDHYAFFVENFSDLRYISDSVAKQICRDTSGATIHSRIGDVCINQTSGESESALVSSGAYIAENSLLTPVELCQNKKIYVAFLLDVSSSVGQDGFNKQIKFALDIIDILDISRDKIQVAAITFSNFATLAYNLDTSFDKNDIKSRTSRIKWKKGDTAIGAALNKADVEVFKTSLETTGDIIKVIILITDGVSQNNKLAVTAARNLKDKDVHVFTIGIGRKIDFKQLESLGSTPREKYVFNQTNFSKLDTLKEIIAKSMCKIDKD